ncbi:MAG: hypothetical protein HYT73_01555 [Candidatus Aenigmarchaeota archaeon]|nr:hypothetical protein [Candidatus Aenigmarchaeota archaeon]
MTDKIVLGINDSHPSSACIMANGCTVSCIIEERLTRIKNEHRFPINSIQKMMSDAGINGEQISLVAFSSKDITPADLNEIAKMRKEKRKSIVAFSHAARIFPMKVTESILCPAATRFRRFYKTRKFLPLYMKALRQLGITAPIVMYDHHRVHAATAYYFKGTPKGRRLIFTSDGEGDGLCATVSIAENGNIQRVVSIPFVHSIAKMYNEVTWYLGMKPWEHEYKVMGLAPYSSGHYARKSVDVFERMADVRGVKFRNMTKRWAHSYGLYLRDNLHKHRFDAVAFALQDMAERVTTGWVRNCISRYGIGDIMVCGGFFMNVKCNQRLMEMPEVSSIFATPSGGDESSCIGAAMLGYADLCKEDGSKPRFEEIKNIYLGPSYDGEIEEFVKGIDRKKYSVQKCRDTDKAVGEMLSEGRIVARLSGRMEFGARSLGNRSILADPRNMPAITEINSQIKQRDFWMPFAPSILREDARKLLEMPGKPANDQYMILSFNTTPLGRDVLRAALHQSDFTARPQVVDREWNPGYHSLIKSFKKETGHGGILNTSFNLHGEPIVCTPHDAFSTLERSGLRYLAMGNYVIEKK